MKFSKVVAAHCLALVVVASAVLVSSGNTAHAAPVNSGLVGWYDAGDTNADGIPDALPDDTVVTTWVNKANPGTNDGAAIATPSVANGAGDTLNGQPVMHLSGDTADRDNFLIGTIRTELGGYHAYAVNRSDQTDGQYWQRLVSSWDGTTADYLGNNWAMLRPNQNEGTPQEYAPTITSSSVSSGKVIQDIRIGRNASGDAEWFDGDMAEVLLYDRALNSAEDTLVRNYLSSKFDLSIGSYDQYAGDAAVQGDYDLDVFGIGRVYSSSESTSSFSAGLTIAESGDTLGDNEWVLAGHKVAINSWVADDTPVGLRSDRVWYLDKTGDVDAELTFDLSDAGLSSPSTTDYMLLYSATNAFAFEDLGLTSQVDGDQISFDVSTSLLSDGYYTLAVVPEPSTFVLAAVGLLGLGFVGWQRRKRK